MGKRFKKVMVFRALSRSLPDMMKHDHQKFDDKPAHCSYSISWKLVQYLSREKDGFAQKAQNPFISLLSGMGW